MDLIGHICLSGRDGADVWSIPGHEGGAIEIDVRLVAALDQALDTVIANGRHAEVLDRWNLAGEPSPPRR
jgi:hypothetical protein